MLSEQTRPPRLRPAAPLLARCRPELARRAASAHAVTVGRLGHLGFQMSHHGGRPGHADPGASGSKAGGKGPGRARVLCDGPSAAATNMRQSSDHRATAQGVFCARLP